MSSHSQSNGYFGRTSPSLPCQVLLFSMTFQEYLFGHFQLSQLCSLPTLFSPSADLLWGQHENQRRSWCCVSTAQQQPNHPCLISTVLVSRLNHSTIQAALKKFNLIPAKPSTQCGDVPVPIPSPMPPSNLAYISHNLLK